MKNLSKILFTAVATVFCMNQINAQRPVHGSSIINSKNQKMINTLSKLTITNEKMSRAERPSGASRTNLERLRAIFINYGGGNDSITFNYSSNRRGSSYDYTNLELFGYECGYPYLSDTRSWVQFDTMNYITDAHYSGTYVPYSLKTSGYDTFLNNTIGVNGINNATGVFQPSNMFLKTYSNAGDLTKKIDSTTFVSGQFTDGKTSFIASYLSPGKLLESEENDYLKIKTQNTYNASGLITTQNLYYFDTLILNNWMANPYSTTSNTYDASGNKLTVVTIANDTTKMKMTYNSSNQQTSLINLQWNHAKNNFDTVNYLGYVYPNATSDWTISTTTIFDPTTMVWGFVTDSTVRTFDTNHQVLTAIEYVDDGEDTQYTGTTVNTWYAIGKLSSLNISFVQPGVDTLLSSHVLTFNAAGSPITCNHLATEGYGGDFPDTIFNTKERYYYETYSDDPTAIKGTPSQNLKLEIYPNPSTNQLHISCAELKEAEMTITNMNGQTVRNYKIDLGNTEAIIDIENLAQGNYFVGIKNAKTGQSVTRKISKIN